VERAGERRSIALARERQDEGFAPVGIKPSAPAAVVAVSAQSPAAGAGLESGDRIVRVGAAQVSDRYALEALLPELAPPLEIEVSRPSGDAEETRVVTLRELPAERTLAALGLWPLDFQIVDVNPLTPASSAGIRSGDIPLAIGGQPVQSAAQLVETIRTSEGRKLALVLLRGDETLEVEVEPLRQAVPGKDGGVETHYALGVGLGAPLVGGEMRVRVRRNPVEAFAFGALNTAADTAAIARGFVELFSGSIGLGSLAGPIGIGAAAAQKFQSSWVEFLGLMVAISINLALLNLLPIPVLDGGTIVLTCAEWLRGGPLPLRARDWAQTVGLSFILMLMGVAFWNDLWRLVRSLG
jgi:regulator of sigma E protease